MDLFIKLSNNQYPLNHTDVRQAAYPTALGEVITNEILIQHGFARVVPTTPPAFSIGQYVVEVTPTNVGGTYTQTFEVRDYDLETKKQIKLNYFNKMFNDLIGQVKTTYPSTEVESWAKQEKEARDYIADNNAQATLLREIALARGASVEWFANKVISKADQYALVVGKLIGTRQLLEHRILNATESTIDGIVWPPE